MLRGFFFNRLFVTRLPQVQTARHNLLVWKLISHFSTNSNGVYTINPLGDEWFMHLVPRAGHPDQELRFFRAMSRSASSFADDKKKITLQFALSRCGRTQGAPGVAAHQ